MFALKIAFIYLASYLLLTHMPPVDVWVVVVVMFYIYFISRLIKAVMKEKRAIGNRA